MKEQLISFTVAKLAKEKGFDAVTNSVYRKSGELKTHNKWDTYNAELDGICNKFGYSAATQSLLQKWLREGHEIFALVSPYPSAKKFRSDVFKLLKIESEDEALLTIMSSQFNKHNSYEEALEKGLVEALNLIK